MACSGPYIQITFKGKSALPCQRLFGQRLSDWFQALAGGLAGRRPSVWPSLEPGCLGGSPTSHRWTRATQHSTLLSTLPLCFSKLIGQGHAVLGVGVKPVDLVRLQRRCGPVWACVGSFGARVYIISVSAAVYMTTEIGFYCCYPGMLKRQCCLCTSWCDKSKRMRKVPDHCNSSTFKAKAQSPIPLLKILFRAGAVQFQ